MDVTLNKEVGFCRSRSGNQVVLERVEGHLYLLNPTHLSYSEIGFFLALEDHSQLISTTH